MCLATPARIEQRTGDDAWVSLGATRVRVNLAMTPEAGVGDWVLVHAGFAIEQLDETSVRLIVGVAGRAPGGAGGGGGEGPVMTTLRQRMSAVTDRLRADAGRLGRTVQLMEVCGTHTVNACRSGLHALMPESVRAAVGPGCPVCVTAQRYIDALVRAGAAPDVTIATYGDMVRVAGAGGSLELARSEGADVRVVTSAMEAVDDRRARAGAPGGVRGGGVRDDGAGERRGRAGREARRAGELLDPAVPQARDPGDADAAGRSGDNGSTGSCARGT
jgi:hydrogenase assembly chaperone HypC/HupF